jgi:UDP-N-acetylglucosamine 2-epimerase (non-hydrolysing)
LPYCLIALLPYCLIALLPYCLIALYDKCIDDKKIIYPPFCRNEMKRYKIACILGTRPETIKMAPVILALKAMPDYFDVDVICTGQHRELIIPLIDWFDLSISKNMDLMQENQGLSDLGGRVLIALSAIFKERTYDCVVGQGDTTTVCMSALAAFHEKIMFAHIEAGLRTFDRHSPFPEEINRVLISRLASMHFAPTDETALNLYNEGVSRESVFITGNTVIDALCFTVDRLKKVEAQPSPKKIVLVTAHRRENFGAPLERICQAIRRMALDRDDVCFYYLVHPNPNVRQMVFSILQSIPNVTLLDPLPYQDLVHYLNKCDIVLTDSGGLQEEAPMLKKPVLVLREETERSELVSLGGAILVGSNEEKIIHWVTKLLTDRDVYEKMILGYSPYGDGKASLRIVDYLLTRLRHC